MSIINYASREIQFKIVYYGPALCGKTTNLAYIHQRINPENRGDLVSLATAADRTLFFDFLPLNAVVIKGFFNSTPCRVRSFTMRRGSSCCAAWTA
jgi:GTPase SAR1 family protein